MFNLNFENCEEYNSNTENKEVETFVNLKNIELLTENMNSNNAQGSDGQQNNEDLIPDVGAPVEPSNTSSNDDTTQKFPLEDSVNSNEVQPSKSDSDLSGNDLDNDTSPVDLPDEETSDDNDEPSNQDFFEKYKFFIILILIGLLIAALSKE